ncbi:hypothetical protein [Bosea sp. UC22_33]|uniref:hypothetical protein n=1 Tax=Bosea sp. UC22_33 TaxID=3350165 RepID=UPI00366DFB62
MSAEHGAAMTHLDFSFLSNPFERAFFESYWTERDGIVSGVVARELGFLDAKDVTDLAGLPEKFRGRGWLWRRIEKAMTTYCERRGHPVAKCPWKEAKVPFWPPEAVAAWLDDEGRDEIAKFMAKPGRSAQIVELLTAREMHHER